VARWDPSLTAEERRIIRAEERLAAQAVAAIRAEAQAARPDWYAQLEELREQAMAASHSDLPAIISEMEVLKRQSALQRRHQLPDPTMPYFAHMRLLTGEEEQDVLLGYHSFVKRKLGVRIVDWRHAPVADVFFTCREGEDYERPILDGSIAGTLLQRHIVAFQLGVLALIRTPHGAFVREPSGPWMRDSQALPALSGGLGGSLPERLLGTGAAGAGAPVVSALLDREQYAALQQDEERPLLLLGGAGCGKTTVALHRLAALCHRHPQRFAPKDAIAIVPQEGLLRLTRMLLDGLRMHAVAASSFDAWITEQARHAHRDLPRRICAEPHPDVVRFKRHRALNAALPGYVQALGRRMAARIDHQLLADGQVEALFANTKADNLLAVLNRVERRYRTQLAPEKRTRAKRIFRKERKRLFQVDPDRRALLQDRSLLRSVAAASQGELGERHVQRVLDHTWVQVSTASERHYSHVDPERLKTLDGRSIDAGTPDEDSGTVDVEDFALCLALQRLKLGPPRTQKGRMQTYSAMVADEAQELAPVELAALGSVLRPEAAITVAGDQAQQIDMDAGFTTWEDAIRHLCIERTQPVVLRTSYRCPRPIARFAHAVLGPLAPAELPHAPKPGSPVTRSRFPNLGVATLQLQQVLADLAEREPLANVAVITRSPQAARKLHGVLTRGVQARLVRDGDFDFQPGLVVTDVAQVKGLEFDYVVIWNASEASYPNDPYSRRAMHVAASRAIHQLWATSIGPFSPLVPQEE